MNFSYKKGENINNQEIMKPKNIKKFKYFLSKDPIVVNTSYNYNFIKKN